MEGDSRASNAPNVPPQQRDRVLASSRAENGDRGLEGKTFHVPKEAASFLRSHVRTLEDWRREGRGPRFYKLGSRKRAKILYRRRDLETWVDMHLMSACGPNPLP
ncbi:helix-turn-helix transcriptional regulator [Hyphomicrobium sp. B1]|uniref:helix-turn-helix transcriptional regulator n=1 Tax=Hyphomicrobium sp. B1 TaxID=3075651 RepID=UPI003C2F9E6E